MSLPRSFAHFTPRQWLAVGAILAISGCATLPIKDSPHMEVWGFTAPWDSRSARSLSTHRPELDVAISGWIALDSTTYQPVTLFPDSFVTHTPSIHTMALVTSYQGTRFHPETLRGIGAGSSMLPREAGAIATVVRNAGYQGIVLDLEGMTRADLPILSAFTRAVTDSAHAHRIAMVGLALPALDTLDYPTAPLAQTVDCLIVMLYDQHWLTSPPGPIASPAWVAHMLELRTHDISPTKFVAAFPTYGYQWRPDSATAVLSYADAQQLAAQARVPLERDTTSLTLHAKTPLWELWSSDAILLDRLVYTAQQYGITRIALWRLGLEDPAVWSQVIRWRLGLEDRTAWTPVIR